MTQYNFTTNIEKRMPTTGEVFFVDRMTSDYAVQHPFDVDGYLEQVYQKWQACETVGFRETREALRRQWDATLGERNPRGNAVLYPNKNGEKHPALMEVWHKAGDYWRRGLRLGDVLPAVVPPCKITRTEDGWIALFPKDMHLLENEELRMKNEEFATAQRPEGESQFATAQRLQAEREAEAQQHQREQEQEGQRRDQELQALVERELQRQLHRSSSCRVSDEQRQDIDHPTDEPAQPATARRKHFSLFTLHSSLLRPLAVAAASVVACIVIYETGLLIPMGLIGLATSGLVK